MELELHFCQFCGRFTSGKSREEMHESGDAVLKFKVGRFGLKTKVFQLFSMKYEVNVLITSWVVTCYLD